MPPTVTSASLAPAAAARPDLYGLLHRALRLMLAQLAEQVATTDWSASERALAACAALERGLDLLDEHGALEDRHVAPLLGQAAPVLRREIDADHTAIHVLHLALREQVRAIRSGAWTTGERVPRLLHATIEAQFRHMRREEAEAQPRLWDTFGDDELLAMTARVKAGVAPALAGDFLTIMVPVMSAAERDELTANLRHMPPPARALAVELLARHPLIPALVGALGHDD